MLASMWLWVEGWRVCWKKGRVFELSFGIFDMRRRHDVSAIDDVCRSVAKYDMVCRSRLIPTVFNTDLPSMFAPDDQL